MRPIGRARHVAVALVYAAANPAPMALRRLPPGYIYTTERTDTMLTASDLMGEMRLAQSGDWWGDTKCWLFAVCGEMYERGLPIPREWQYRPGLSPKDPDLYETKICEGASDAALLTFGRALTRYANMLEAAGQDY